MNEDRLKKIETYGDEAVTLLTWLFNKCDGVAKEMGELIDFNSANISKVYNCKYDSDIAIVLDRIRVAQSKSSRKELTSCVESTTLINIRNLLDNTASLGAISMICGAARRGKTYAVKHWMRQQVGGFFKPIYIDVPSSKSSVGLVFEMARVLGILANGSRAAIENKIYSKLSNRTVLIFDESTRIFHMNKPTEALEMIRRINDTLGVPIVFVATEWFADEIKNGRLSVYLEQLNGRMEDVLIIPTKVTRKEVEAFLRPHTDGKPSKEIMKIAMEIVETNGKIATLTRHIADAKILAHDDNEDFINEAYLLAAVQERLGEGLWE